MIGELEFLSEILNYDTGFQHRYIVLLKGVNGPISGPSVSGILCIIKGTQRFVLSVG